ncbi:DUF2946 family protein [Tateyamaria sp. ANG-S1]|uniref:DUF2946 family protein n=1 Tax=Tateyamaria sp. ANG-S1 TaxID=1577905 RepID=UPI00068AA2B5|nr:DUF2946 family protein [Tateyamaria sp. ANG-S1]
MTRSFYAILLSLVLVVTSHSAAIARGSATAVDHIVICSGTTVTMVFIDAEGQPTETPHLCPDCVLHLLAAVLPFQDPAAPLLRSATAVAWLSAPARAGAPWRHRSARAPPVLI